MPDRHALICTLLVLTASAALGEADYVDNSALHEAGLVKFWQLHLPLQDGQQVVDSYLVDDQVYLTTQDGYAYAVHAHTGAVRWIKQVTTGGYRVRRPCHAADRTIFITSPAITQYDRYIGEPIRRTELRFPAGSPAVSDGTRLYIGGIDQRIYAFYVDQDFENWKARAPGPIVSQPALFGQHLYFASEDGSVYACVAETKEFYWRARAVGSITADVVADENGVYIASRDHSLYLLDPGRGRRRWRTRFSGPLYEAPAVTVETAFQYCADDGLAAINTGTVDVEERVRWILPRGRQLLATHEKLAYVFSRDASILVVRLADGKILHTIPTPGFSMPMYSPDDPALYLAAGDGRVFCGRKRGVPPVMADDLRQALRRPAGPEDQAPQADDESARKPASDEDLRESKRPGPPVGGKSKVSKRYPGE